MNECYCPEIMKTPPPQTKLAVRPTIRYPQTFHQDCPVTRVERMRDRIVAAGENAANLGDFMSGITFYYRGDYWLAFPRNNHTRPWESGDQMIEEGIAYGRSGADHDSGRYGHGAIGCAGTLATNSDVILCADTVREGFRAFQTDPVSHDPATGLENFCRCTDLSDDVHLKRAFELFGCSTMHMYRVEPINTDKKKKAYFSPYIIQALTFTRRVAMRNMRVQHISGIYAIDPADASVDGEIKPLGPTRPSGDIMPSYDEIVSLYRERRITATDIRCEQQLPGEQSLRMMVTVHLDVFRGTSTSSNDGYRPFKARIDAHPEIERRGFLKIPVDHFFFFDGAATTKKSERFKDAIVMLSNCQKFDDGLEIALPRCTASNQDAGREGPEGRERVFVIVSIHVTDGQIVRFNDDGETLIASNLNAVYNKLAGLSLCNFVFRDQDGVFRNISESIGVEVRKQISEVDRCYLQGLLPHKKSASDVLTIPLVKEVVVANSASFVFDEQARDGLSPLKRKNANSYPVQPEGSYLVACGIWEEGGKVVKELHSKSQFAMKGEGYFINACDPEQLDNSLAAKKYFTNAIPNLKWSSIRLKVFRVCISSLQGKKSPESPFEAIDIATYNSLGRSLRNPNTRGDVCPYPAASGTYQYSARFEIEGYKPKEKRTGGPREEGNGDPVNDGEGNFVPINYEDMGPILYGSIKKVRGERKLFVNLQKAQMRMAFQGLGRLKPSVVTCSRKLYGILEEKARLADFICNENDPAENIKSAKHTAMLDVLNGMPNIAISQIPQDVERSAWVLWQMMQHEFNNPKSQASELLAKIEEAKGDTVEVETIPDSHVSELGEVFDELMA